jgi:Mg2+ and Co2+ transporter CorA
MEMSSRDWSQQYESLKKRIQNQRINGISFTAEDIRLIEKQISLLESQLKTMSSNSLRYELAASEIARREVLLANIKTLTANMFKPAPGTGSGPFDKPRSPYTSNTGSGQGQTQVQTQADIMKLQDDMVREIGTGVDRLHGKARVIGEEAKAHVRLLDDLDNNVEIASAALQAEAQHAAEIKEKGKVCYMYICIAVECAVLLLLVILAFG